MSFRKNNLVLFMSLILYGRPYEEDRSMEYLK